MTRVITILLALFSPLAALAQAHDIAGAPRPVRDVGRQFRRRARYGARAAHGGELPALRARRRLRRHGVPSRDRELRDPGRRLRRSARGADRRGRRSRTRAATASRTAAERSASRARTRRTPAARSSTSTSPTTPASTRCRAAGAMRSSAASSKAWTSSIASATCARKPSPSFGADVPVERPRVLRAYVVEVRSPAAAPATQPPAEAKAEPAQ